MAHEISKIEIRYDLQDYSNHGYYARAYHEHGHIDVSLDADDVADDETIRYAVDRGQMAFAVSADATVKWLCDRCEDVPPTLRSA